MWETSALVELLERKGVLTKQEVLDMMQELRQREPTAIRPKRLSSKEIPPRHCQDRSASPRKRYYLPTGSYPLLKMYRSSFPRRDTFIDMQEAVVG